MTENAPWFWMAPKECFMEFSKQANQQSTYFHIGGFTPHDEKYYLVTMHGSYPFLETKMQAIIDNYEKKANFSIQKWIDFELERIAQILPGQVETNPASFSCGHTAGYKACLLDLDKLLDKEEE